MATDPRADTTTCLDGDDPTIIFPHPPLHPFAIDVATARLQLLGDSPASIAGPLQGDLLHLIAQVHVRRRGLSQSATGEPQYYAKPGLGDDGLLWWGPRLFDVAGGAQSQGAHFQAQYLMGEQRYVRVDYKMPSDPWPLDDIAALPQLLHYGEQAAIKIYPRIRDRFFATPKLPYQPFPNIDRQR